MNQMTINDQMRNGSQLIIGMMNFILLIMAKLECHSSAGHESINCGIPETSGVKMWMLLHSVVIEDANLERKVKDARKMINL